MFYKHSWVITLQKRKVPGTCDCEKKQTLLWTASQWCQAWCYLTVRGYVEIFFRVLPDLTALKDLCFFPLWFLWRTTLKNLFKIKAWRSNTPTGDEVQSCGSQSPSVAKTQLSAIYNQHRRYCCGTGPWEGPVRLSVPVPINQQPGGGTSEALPSPDLTIDQNQDQSWDIHRTTQMITEACGTAVFIRTSFIRGHCGSAVYGFYFSVLFQNIKPEASFVMGWTLTQPGRNV